MLKYLFYVPAALKRKSTPEDAFLKKYSATILPQQSHITLVVFFLPIFEGAVYNIYIHTARLVYTVEFTIPSAAIERCAFKYFLAPAVVNVHTKRNEPAAQVLAREEVIIKPVPVWREHIGYVHVAVVLHGHSISSAAAINIHDHRVYARLYNRNSGRSSACAP